MDQYQQLSIRPAPDSRVLELEERRWNEPSDGGTAGQVENWLDDADNFYTGAPAAALGFEMIVVPVSSRSALAFSSSPLRMLLKAIAIALALIPMAAVPCAVADPATFISAVGSQGIRALASDVSVAERVSRLQQLFRDDFDIPGIGLFALGRYRLSATPQEQQEFFRLYPDFTVRALSNRLDEYGGATFRVTGTRAVGSETVVASEITRGSGTRVEFDWYLSGDGGQYRITDVTVGGVSMKVALRDQFASWIENNGRRFGALLTVLRQQIARAL